MMGWVLVLRGGSGNVSNECTDTVSVHRKKRRVFCVSVRQAGFSFLFFSFFQFQEGLGQEFLVILICWEKEKGGKGAR